MSGLAGEFRAALRALRKRTSISVVVVLTLTLAITSATAVFGVVSTTYLTPPPYPNYERLVALSAARSNGAVAWSSIPRQTLDEIRSRAHTFDLIAEFNETEVVVGAHNGRPAWRMSATFVDTALLQLVGARPARGRMPSAAEIRSHTPVALIGDSLWRESFGGTDDAIGQGITINEITYAIVGVMPPRFAFFARSNAWLPMNTQPDSVSPNRADGVSAVGRLRDGVKLQSARDEVEQIGRTLARENPSSYRQWRLIVRDELLDRTRGAWRTFSILFFALGSCVFLISCVNVGNLLLLRVVERRSEMVLRVVLGATRFRLIRQALVENLILAVSAGILSLLLIAPTIDLLWSVFPTGGMPSWFASHKVDWWVFAYCAGIVTIAVSIFGTVPIRESWKLALAESLKGAASAIATDRSLAAACRRSVVVQVALSTTLLVAAGLCVKSYWIIADVDRGFPAERIVSVRASLSRSRYPSPDDETRYYDELARRIETDPAVAGVTVAGSLNALRMQGSAPQTASAGGSPEGFGLYRSTDDLQRVDDRLRPPARFGVVAAKYFRILQRRLTSGREFDDSDVLGSLPVLIISERLARTIWPNESAVGQQLRLSRLGPWFTVVGVAADAPRAIQVGNRSSVEGLNEVYLVKTQASMSPQLLVTAKQRASDLWPSIGRAAAEVDPTAPLLSYRTLASENGDAEQVVRVAGEVAGSFAIGAFTLAIIGIFGSVSYSVATRTREIGLRMALGSSGGQVVRMLMLDNLRSVAIGLCAGGLFAFMLASTMAWLLVDVQPFDSVVFSLVALLFVTTGVGASWLPARRATRIEPHIILTGQ